MPFHDSRTNAFKTAYTVEGIPSLVLVGPDGRVLSKDGRDYILQCALHTSHGLRLLAHSSAMLRCSDPDGQGFPWYKSAQVRESCERALRKWKAERQSTAAAKSSTRAATRAAAVGAAAEQTTTVAAQQAKRERMEREARQQSKLRKNIEDRLDAVSDQLVRLEDTVYSGAPITASTQATLDRLTDELDLMTDGSGNDGATADRRRKLSRRVENLYAKAILTKAPASEPEPDPEPMLEPESGLVQLCGNALEPASLTRTTVNFEMFETVGVPLRATSGKIFYEVEVLMMGTGAQFGWATTTFDVSTHHCCYSGVGDDDSSWAVDGERTLKWSNGSTSWGEAWKVGDTIGFAADLVTGELRFGRNGSWEHPMGLAFTDMRPKGGLFPALSASRPTRVVVNLGDRPWSYGPPDDTYLGIIPLQTGVTLFEIPRPQPHPNSGIALYLFDGCDQPEVANAWKQFQEHATSQTQNSNLSAYTLIVEKLMPTFEEHLPAALPHVISCYSILVSCYQKLGLWDKSEQFCPRAYKMLDSTPAGSPVHGALITLRCAEGMACFRTKNDRKQHGEKCYHHALKIVREMTHPSWRQLELNTIHQFAGELLTAQQPKEAMTELQSAMVMLDKLSGKQVDGDGDVAGPAHPMATGVNGAINRSSTLGHIAHAARRMGNMNAAETHLTDAIKLVSGVSGSEQAAAMVKTLKRDLNGLFAARPDTEVDLSTCNSEVVEAWEKLKAATQTQNYSENIPVMETAVETFEASLPAAHQISMQSYIHLGRNYQHVGMWDKCDKLCARASEKLDTASAGGPVKQTLITLCCMEGMACFRNTKQDRKQHGESCYRRALKVVRELNHPSWRPVELNTIHEFGREMLSAGMSKEAVKELNGALKMLDDLATEQVDEDGTVIAAAHPMAMGGNGAINRSAILRTMSQAAASAGNMDAAVGGLNEAIRLASEVNVEKANMQVECAKRELAHLITTRLPSRVAEAEPLLRSVLEMLQVRKAPMTLWLWIATDLGDVLGRQGKYQEVR